MDIYKSLGELETMEGLKCPNGSSYVNSLIDIGTNT